MVPERGLPAESAILALPVPQGPGSPQTGTAAPLAALEALPGEKALRAVTAWLAESRASINTFRTYRREAGRFLGWVRAKGGNLDEALRTVQPSDVSAFLSMRGGKGTTVSNRLSCLRSMFKALIADGVVQSNPAREVQAPRGASREAEHHRAIPASLLLRVLKRLPDDTRGRRDRALLLLACNNGLRRAELAGLRLGDLRLEDEDSPSIRVRGKGRRVDILPLKSATVRALKAWLDVRDQEAGIAPRSPVFHSLARGRRTRGLKALSGAGVYAIFKRYFPKHSPHCARSRFCSDCYIRSDGQIEVARVMARHVSSSTTQSYVQVDRVRSAAVYAPEYS